MPFVLPPKLRADCGNCRALCCVGPAFDAEQGFAFDKPANVPCPNLRADFRCAVHDHLRPRGFPSCASFDCYGAGQRVTRLFGGSSWRDSPDVALRMFNAYSRYRSLHHLMALLTLAIENVPSGDAVRLTGLRDSIDRLCESGAAIDGSIPMRTLERVILARVRLSLMDRTRRQPIFARNW